MDLGETPSYSASHPDPKLLAYNTIVVLGGLRVNKEISKVRRYVRWKYAKEKTHYTYIQIWSNSLEACFTVTLPTH